MSKFAILAAVWIGFAASSSAGADEDQKSELTIEQFLQQLSTVPGVLHRKDPFVKPPPPYQSILESWRVSEAAGGQPASDLERFEVKDYVVQAVLLGDVYNRALVRVPNGKGDVMILRENDRLGNRGGVVTLISAAGLTIIQKSRSRTGVVDSTTIVLPVGDAKFAGGGKI